MTATAWTASTDTAERVKAEVSDAAARGASLRIKGAGNWLDAGAPVDAAQAVSLADDARIVEYVPGDLTLTARAGTALAQINEVVARDNQWLALDPFGDERGTIGATIATASYGPLAHAFGTPRDQLLGVEFVTGSGDMVRGGGRVTKNVAGFDLSRLVCGAWGTLGVITEVTLRLRARPERDVTLAIPLNSATEPDDVARRLTSIRTAALTPAAMELLDRGMCSAAGLEMDGALVLRFCGNEPAVEAQIRRVYATVPAEECQAAVWDRMRRSDRSDHIVFRLSSRPSTLPTLWVFVSGLAAKFAGSRMSASVSRGVIRCSVPFKWSDAIASALQTRPASGLVCERLPRSLWPVLAPPADLGDRLTTRARRAFDPHGILNPGIMGESR